MRCKPCIDRFFLSIFTQFCSEYKTLSEDPNRGFDYIVRLKFVATNSKRYLLLQNSDSRQSLYELEHNCEDCPRVGAQQELSHVFEGVSHVSQAFIQNGLTYVFHETVIDSVIAISE